MNNRLTHAIWEPETGIVDLDADPLELSASQIPGIRAVWAEQQERLKDSGQLADFAEKLGREWAIETGITENLYDIDRDAIRTLIEHGFQAELPDRGSMNKRREYVIRLIHDHKEALDGILDLAKDHRRSLSTSYIKELHATLLRNQETTEAVDSHGQHTDIPLIKGDWKTQTNDPERNGVTYTCCPPEHVNAEMDRLVALHEGHVAKSVPCEVQAAWFYHRFMQIRPFQGGNGRVARAIASLILLKDGLFPLVVPREDKSSCIGALEAADAGSLKPLVDVIAKSQITRFRKATAASGALLAGGDVAAAVDDLQKAAEKLASSKRQELRGVFDHARALEADLEKKLGEIAPSVEIALKKIQDEARAFVNRSNPDNDYYFRGQIIDNARDHIGYYADTSEYQSWVALKLYWSRRGQLVFAIHGFGKPFNGSLTCAPFLEFRDMDEEAQARPELVPITEEGFVFFYNEDQERLLSRFDPWRKNIITAALKELSRNL